MKSRLRILIAGGGSIGLCAAAMFAALPRRDRLSITLVDAGPAPGSPLDGDVGLRVSALSAGTLARLDQLGAGATLAQRECPYADMRVWDEAGDAFGPETLHCSAVGRARPALASIVEDGLLRHALAERLADCDVSLRFDAAVQSFATGGAGCRARLADGETLVADLLVAADGARSAVREAAGIELDGWRYPQSALVTHARPERGHEHTAWQRFLANGPLALLPLADGRVSIVWSTGSAEARRLGDATDDELSAELTAASDRVLGRLEVAAGRAVLPLAARHARRYVQRGVALIGDAAHTVHPLAGQGANLGIADAAALAQVVDAALAAGEFPADLPVLRRYERQRRGANAAMLYFIDGLNRLFGSERAPLATLRGSGMRLFNRSGPLKRRAMRVALGFDAGGALGR